jgi:DNA-binding PadR family transcriptional regulator
MKRDGLIAAATGEDRRESRWIMTSRGQEQLKRAMPRWRHAQRSVEKLLGPDMEHIRSAAHELSTRLSAA